MDRNIGSVRNIQFDNLVTAAVDNTGARATGSAAEYANNLVNGTTEFLSSNLTGIGFLNNPARVGAAAADYGFLSYTNGLSRTRFVNRNTEANRRQDIDIGTGISDTEDVYLGVNQCVSSYKAYLDNRSGGSFQIQNNGNGILSFDTTGNIIPLGHMSQDTANGDLAGIFNLRGVTSARHKFATAFANVPVCVIAPTNNLGTTSWLDTTSTTAVTVPVTPRAAWRSTTFASGIRNNGGRTLSAESCGDSWIL